MISPREALLQHALKIVAVSVGDQRNLIVVAATAIDVGKRIIPQERERLGADLAGRKSIASVLSRVRHETRVHG